MNRKEASALSVEQQQQQSTSTTDPSRNIAVAPPSGAALTRHDSENKTDESQLYSIVSHHVERHY